ncbi:diaminopimelate decarboxylase family protein [Lysobacter korlensis]|uniref:Diaminopimelate decarboxylase n=1 Tax=Lysobacter korlensis TaxID=553636 RepID=A0ABV6RZQ1_9GAMM
MSASPLAPSWLRRPADANALAATVWPPSARRGESGELTIAGVTAAELREGFGTPLYVLDEDDVRRRARDIRTAFEREFARIGSGVTVYYAGKAFLSTEVARWVADEGCSIDVASGGELAVALAAGVPAERLGLHGNNKSDRELDRAAEAGLGTVVIDSEPEIARVAAAAERHGRTQRVRLRINSGVHAHTHEYLATAREDQKFGIPLAEAARIVALIREQPALAFVGLHSHIGSQIFESDGFGEAARRLLAVHAELLAGGDVAELNLGGGFGIAYTENDRLLTFDVIAARFADIVAGECRTLGIPVPRLAIEPGRAIVGPAGVTLYEVGTIKPVEVTLEDADAEGSHTSVAELVEATATGVHDPLRRGSGRATGSGTGATATRLYVSVDGGMSDNIRPALYGADYSARLANRVSDADPALARVVGKHCESGDVVVHDVYLPSDVRSGDLLAVPATGAYCWSLSNNYNYLARPPVVAVRDGAARVIVRGETEEDLLRRDAGIEIRGVAE